MKPPWLQRTTSFVLRFRGCALGEAAKGLSRRREQQIPGCGLLELHTAVARSRDSPVSLLSHSAAHVDSLNTALKTMRAVGTTPGWPRKLREMGESGALQIDKSVGVASLFLAHLRHHALACMVQLRGSREWGKPDRLRACFYGPPYVCMIIVCCSSRQRQIKPASPGFVLADARAAVLVSLRVVTSEFQEFGLLFSCG